jgi:hypothetical protein
MSQGEPPRTAGRHLPGGAATGSGRLRQRGRDGHRPANLPYLIVLAGVVGGLLWVWLSQTHVKGGIALFAAAILLAGVARLVLTDEQAGLFVSRGRAVDVAAFAILGAGLLAAAVLIPNPS